MKAWMKAGAVLVALGGLAAAIPAVQAQGDPTIEACTRYAEADVVFENTNAEAEAAYEAAMQKAVASYEAYKATKPWEAYEAAVQEPRAVRDAAIQRASDVWAAARQKAFAAKSWDDRVNAEQAAENAYEVAKQDADNVYEAATRMRLEKFKTESDAAKAARDSARKEAKAARDAAVEDARYVLTDTYLAIHADGGGKQSDVWEVTVKLLNHQRNRCTQLYGL